MKLLKTKSPEKEIGGPVIPVGSPPARREYSGTAWNFESVDVYHLKAMPRLPSKPFMSTF